MERKTKIEIAIAIAVILIFMALVLWKFWPQASVQTSTPAQSSGSITTSNDKTTPTNSGTAPEETVPVVYETSPSTVARTFVERFGSYSSEVDAANIDDVLPMTTATFRSELEALASEYRSTDSGSYYGVSTLVVTAPRVVSSSETVTVLTMTTQREETIDSPGNTTVKYQDITVTLVKAGTTWLVDEYRWSDAR